MISEVTCFGCGALVPNIQGPTHKYMLSSPGCWQIYGQILAKEYDPQQYNADIHRVTVDTYAVTHPGNNERKAIQSVHVHLVSLFCIYEKAMSGTEATYVLRNLAENKKLAATFVYLDPPSFQQTLHITDVVKAITVEEHRQLVHEWGKSVWDVWKGKHQDTITRIVTQLGF